MDKNTLSQYGWVIIAIIVLAVMIGLATPFGNFVSESVMNTTKSFAQKVVLSFNDAGVDIDNDLGGNDVIEVPEATKMMSQVYVGNNLLYERNNVLKSELTENPGKDDFDLVITFRDGSTSNVLMSYHPSENKWRYHNQINGASITITITPDAEYREGEGIVSSSQNNFVSFTAIKDGYDYDGVESISALGVTIPFTNVDVYGWVAADPITSDSSKITRFIYTFEDGTQSIYEPNFVSQPGMNEGFGHGFTNTGDEEFSFEANLVPVEKCTYFFVAIENGIMGYVNGGAKTVSTITIEQEIDGNLVMDTYTVIPA